MLFPQHLLSTLAITALTGLSACSTVAPSLAPGAAAPAVRSASPRPEQLAAEELAEARAWQTMRGLLLISDYSEKLPQLEAMWNLTATPAQWVALRRAIEESSTELDPRLVVVINACRAAAHGSFDDVFRAACQRADGPTSLFGGLFVWARTGGNPVFQGRQDLALHFICGGLTEAMLHNGIEMGIAKERQDRVDGGPFDLDDLAATAAGAIWVQLARDDPNWVKSWAAGRASLDSVRPLRHGQNQPFDGPKLMEICQQLFEDFTGTFAAPISAATTEAFVATVQRHGR